ILIPCLGRNSASGRQPLFVGFSTCQRHRSVQHVASRTDLYLIAAVTAPVLRVERQTPADDPQYSPELRHNGFDRLNSLPNMTKTNSDAGPCHACVIAGAKGEFLPFAKSQDLCCGLWPLNMFG